MFPRTRHLPSVDDVGRSGALVPHKFRAGRPANSYRPHRPCVAHRFNLQVTYSVARMGDDVPRNTANWSLRASPITQASINPIRRIVDDLAGKENPQKELISLAQGDPTAYGHLKPPEQAVAAVVRAFLSGNHNGYTAGAHTRSLFSST